MTAIDISGSPLSGTDISADTGARHARLLHAAQQFEAVMLSELMKPLSSSAAIGEDGEAAAGGTMKSFGVEAMAGAMAKSGALGFANRIVTSVEQHENKLSNTVEQHEKKLSE